MNKKDFNEMAYLAMKKALSDVNMLIYSHVNFEDMYSYNGFLTEA